MDRASKIIINYLADWSLMLSHFTKSSSVVGSLYLPNGERILGPFSGEGFGKYLLESKNFEENRVCHQFESERVRKACLSQKFDDCKFESVVTVKLLPILINNEVVAVIVFGWIFEHFPDPDECNRVAGALGVGDMLFWKAAWLQTGTSKEMLVAFQIMLGLLCTTLVKQLIQLYHTSLHSRFKEELLEVVSHELKTSVSSNLNASVSEEFRKFLIPIEDNVKIHGHIIENLLVTAKIISGKFSLKKDMTDLTYVVSNAMENIKEDADKKMITILSSGLDEKHPFHGDSLRLQQVFWNILSNSVKFTKDGSLIMVNITKNPSNYVITLSDNGGGIEKSFLPHIFKRFAQDDIKVDKPIPGVGIGLSVVKTIIDFHESSIEVDSKGEGLGTTFKIILPRENLF